jgi:arsenate reductase
MAEAIMNFMGKPHFTAYSAGSHPSGAVRPEAIAELESARLPTDGLRSKSWQEFSMPGAPKLDFVFTVCDNAAAAHGTPDEIKDAYRGAFVTLERRIELFLSLPLATIDRLAIKQEIDKIGHQ